jgi:hypothetical protein
MTKSNKKKTKLYQLQRKKTERISYDETRGMIVRATSPAEARVIASTHQGDEGREAWLDTSRTTCKVLSSDGTLGLVLKDYLNG